MKEGMSTGFSGLWGAAYQGGMLVGGWVGGTDPWPNRRVSQGPTPATQHPETRPSWSWLCFSLSTGYSRKTTREVPDMSLSLISGSWHLRLLSV